MKFELKEYYRNISKEDLINDLISVAKKLQIEYVSRSVYEKNGKYSATPFISNFGSWVSALMEAGLRTNRIKSEYKKISDKTLLDNVKYVANYLSKNTITTSDYKKHGKYSIGIILDRFGSWEETIKRADLDSTGFVKKLDTYELLNEIERLWILLGRQPTTTDLKNGKSKYSLNSYTRRFGGWRKALEAFVEYINTTDNSDLQTSKDYNDSENIEEHKLDIQAFEKEKTYNKKNKSNVIGFQHKTSRNINARLRFKVLQRDNFKCCACGASPAKDPSVELHVDHIIPWSKGGETIIENLQTLCSKCNLGKSDVL